MFGDKEFGNVGFPTPEDIPVECAYRLAKLPSSAAWLGVFMGMLEAGLNEANWQQFEGAITREQAAAVWNDIIAWMYDNAEVPILLDVRQNPTSPCILEKTFDNVTWVPFADLTLCPTVPQLRKTVTGNVQVNDPTLGWYTIPNGPIPADVWTEVPPTAEMAAQGNDQCTAAANLAYVFRQVYQTVGTSLTEQPTVQVPQLGGAISDVLSRLFSATLAAEFFNTLAGSLVAIQALYAVSPLTDAQFHDLVCIIKPTLSGTNGNWTVNGSALSAALAAKVSTDGPLPWSFINLIGTYFGANGLNLGTKTTNFASYDCTTGEALRLWRVYDDYGVTFNTNNWQLLMSDILPEQFAFMRWQNMSNPNGNTLSSPNAAPAGYQKLNYTIPTNPLANGSDFWWVNQSVYLAPVATTALASIRKAVGNPAYNPPAIYGGGIGTGNYVAGQVIAHTFQTGGGGGGGAWQYHLRRTYYTRQVYGGC